MHFPRILFALASAFFITLAISSCVKRPSLIPLYSHQKPVLLDSGNRDQLLSAVSQHLEYLHTLSPDSSISMGKESFPSAG